VEIDKPDGGKRKLGIPNVIDRLIQQAIAQILTPLFDLFFSTNSFGFRPNRNAKQAVLQVRDIIKQKRKFAVDVDLSKFFDRVNHDLLMTQLGIKVQDKRLLALIADVIRSLLIAAAAQFTDTSHPQGCALINSTLTCNEASESIKSLSIIGKKKIKPR
jgi:retron-type reverse transcriptase